MRVILDTALSSPAVMGIINVSPNSFYRPIRHVESVIREVDSMVAAGADIIDVGGEATNPAVAIADAKDDSVALAIEMDRVVPVVAAIAERFDVLISVDTSRPTVMTEAVKAGAGMINDQRALQLPGALAAIAALSVPVCLMHGLQSDYQPLTASLVTTLSRIKNQLKQAVDRCEQAGISRQRLLIDPGFGQGHFGKCRDENYYLLANLSQFGELGLPILVGWSRKSMIGDVLNTPPQGRLYGSIAAAVISAMHGAAVIRVHDVKATVDAMKIYREMARFISH